MLKKLYHFLGSIYFAIFLIATTATLVVAGTFIEAATQSHRSASLLTYSTPVFLALLTSFFVNILLSALRRWPFTKKHIPFLITHLGLLMIILGTMIKTVFGVQGTLLITEGSGSHDLFLDGTEAIRVEERNSAVAYAPIENLQNIAPLGLPLTLLERVENSQELLMPWVSGNKIYIRGIDPMPLITVSERAIPPAHEQYFPHEETPCKIWAIASEDPEKAIHTLFTSQAKIKILETASGVELATFPLAQLVRTPQPLKLSNGTVLTLAADLDLSFSKEKGCTDPKIHGVLCSGRDEYLLEIPLDGPKALLNRNTTTPHLGRLPITIEITTAPLLAFIVDPQTRVVTTFGSDSIGSVFSTIDDPTTPPEKIFAYDDGFAGYTIQRVLPWCAPPVTREEREKALRTHLAEMLDVAAAEADQGDSLVPPLALFRTCCTAAKVPFGATLVEYLDLADKHHAWICHDLNGASQPLRDVFAQMDLSWHSREKQAAAWAVGLFQRYDPLLQRGTPALSVLREERWPLLDALEKEKAHHDNELLVLLTQQVMYAATYTSMPKQEPDGHHIVSQFSAFMRSYDIHMEQIIPETFVHREPEPIVLETLVNRHYRTKEPLVKIEDNIPSIFVHAKNEHVSLTYDKKGTGLCWPCGGGQYLLRYQPMVQAIPHHIRLRQARQINYPNTTQPYSYEADLLIKDMRTGNLVEKTISMNHVHETDDGYRFYLGSMYPPEAGAVKTIQIVANKDPVKYLLTYPGALILSLGIVLLLCLRPYKE